MKIFLKNCCFIDQLIKMRIVVSFGWKKPQLGGRKHQKHQCFNLRTNEQVTTQPVSELELEESELPKKEDKGGRIEII